ncbi:MAG TPA: hypothetical protein VE135_03325 [Pyrinomonadaceae bacterium]|nr:hypothetical protein [Pyrinomonadaceae bacterium]
MPETGWITTRLKDGILAGAIFVCTLLIFWFSPVHQVTDSKYSMLLSEGLIRHHSFALDHFQLPRLEPVQRSDYVMNGGIYQLEIVGNRIYYFFPPGSSVLSIPYVAAANAFGVSAANSDGTFNLRGEQTIEIGLAALLMAILAALFYFTARLLLPAGWSVIVALSASFGTQIWSTASRGLWSHTWSVLLTGLAVYWLSRADIAKQPLRPIFLATLMSWMYFVRPGNSIQVVCITIFFALYYRRALLPFLLTGAGWLLAFISYSRYNFGFTLPNYYRASRLDLGIFPVALPGNLISPSRGLLIYVPLLLFVVFLLVRYWRHRPAHRLTWLAMTVSIANLLMVSCFAHWWGGASFGPRFTTDTVPWFVLLSIIGIKAMLNWHEQHQSANLAWAGQLTVGSVLLAASIFINGRGALALETWRWNPGDVTQLGNKLWDWRQPQFLAGLVKPPLEHGYEDLAVGTRVDFTQPDAANKYLWYGWSGDEPGFRWTEGKEAALVFAIAEKSDLILKMRLLPFIREGTWPRQRILAELNGQLIDSQVLTRNQDAELSLRLPGYLLQGRNVMKFKLPDAASPELLNISMDQRQLGFAVYWIELQKDNQPQPAAGK